MSRAVEAALHPSADSARPTERDQLTAPALQPPLCSGDGDFLWRFQSTLDPFGQVGITAYDNPAACRSVWEKLEADGNATVYQSFDWVSHWTQSAGAGLQPLLLVASQGDSPLFMLPWAIKGNRSVKAVTWLADTHSNFQMGLFSRAFLEEYDPDGFRSLIMDIVSRIDGADMIYLCCQPAAWAGHDNPFVHVAQNPSVNPAFGLDLNGGFDQALSRINRAGRMKKHRWQLKQLGPERRVRLLVAETVEEVDEFLETAFQQMRLRFSKLGIRNVFESAEVRLFFRNIAITSLGHDEPAMIIHALEIDGKLRATLCGGIASQRYSGFFTSLEDDEYAYLSPGELLFFEAIKDCAGRGVQFFDFGRGVERYKRSWSDTEIAMFDTNIALSFKGKLALTGQRMLVWLKRQLRNSPALWPISKNIRALLYKAGV